MAASEDLGIVYVKSFLEKCDAEKYYSRFRSQGIRDFLDLCLIDNNDLILLEIRDESDRQRILSEVDKIDIKEWLQYHGLAKNTYLEDLRAAGYTNIKTLKQFPIVTEEILDSLNITLTGDRKRFRATVEMLKLSCEEDDQPPNQQLVTQVVGYWNKPDFVAESPCEFLCVKGTLKTSKDENSKETPVLEFLVDTGADVVSVREELIKELELRYLQEVTHCGIHTRTKGNLFRGVLKLSDDDQIEVDIVAGEYESLGLQVFRQFKHFINGSSHRWLRDSDSS